MNCNWCGKEHGGEDPSLWLLKSGGSSGQQYRVIDECRDELLNTLISKAGKEILLAPNFYCEVDDRVSAREEAERKAHSESRAPISSEWVCPFCEWTGLVLHLCNLEVIPAFCPKCGRNTEEEAEKDKKVAERDELDPVLGPMLVRVDKRAHEMHCNAEYPQFRVQHIGLRSHQVMALAEEVAKLKLEVAEWRPLNPLSEQSE